MQSTEQATYWFGENRFYSLQLSKYYISFNYLRKILMHPSTCCPNKECTTVRRSSVHCISVIWLQTGEGEQNEGGEKQSHISCDICVNHHDTITHSRFMNVNSHKWLITITDGPYLCEGYILRSEHKAKITYS